MRKIFLAAPLVLLLSGCATTSGPVTVEQVRQAAVSVCGFLPTAATVAAILAAGNPAVTTATSVAQAICTAVTASNLSARKRGVLPTVNGVVIHGKFVR